MATQPNLSISNGRQDQSAVVRPEAARSATRREYLRKFQAGWVRQRRQEWIAANGPCVLCGSTKDLEVDHKDPATKKIPTRALWGMSPHNPRRIAELAKCQVLCHECHLTKTRRDLRRHALRKRFVNRTGYQGVTLDRCGSYRARVRTPEGRRIALGWFPTAKEAGLAVKTYYASEAVTV